MEEQKFAFPGFQFVGSRDNETHEMIAGILKAGEKEFGLQLIRSRKALKGSHFFLASVNLGEESVWNFRDENIPKGQARLAAADGGHIVIALLENGKVKDIRSFSHLPIKKVKVGDGFIVIDGLSFGERSRLKSLAGKFLGMPVRYTEDEIRIFSALRDRKLAIDREKQERRNIERLERRRKILSRRDVIGWTADGGRRYGIPVVTEDECKYLPDGKFVVRCESYDEEKGTAGVPIEAFRVRKIHGGFKKENLAVVGPLADTAVSAGVPEPAEIIFVLNGEEPEEVLVFKDMESIRGVREAGINSGTLVATRLASGKYQVYSLGPSILTIGDFDKL